MQFFINPPFRMLGESVPVKHRKIADGKGAFKTVILKVWPQLIKGSQGYIPGDRYMRKKILNQKTHLHKKQFKPVLAALVGFKCSINGFGRNIIKKTEAIHVEFQWWHGA